ncbi:MAG: hypothetical protein P8N19_06935 [Flavobacteriales bacterium]|nr:hypothetical protein [Flavobacteriales bacterium]
MKKLIFLLFLLPSSLFAQVEYWYGVDLSRLGYRHNVITLENAPNGQASAFRDNPFREIRGASWEFSSEVMNKHVYFGINGSYLLDIGTALFQYKEKDRWYKNSEYRLERGELFPVQLAFGSNIGKYFALYAGGQYQYTTFGINYNSKVSEFRNVYIGGNQRGAGVHAIFAKGMFFARYSYMHDWIRAAKEFTGMAYTHEFVLHFGPQKFGAFMKLNYVYREMDAGYFMIDRTERQAPEGMADRDVLPGEIGSQFTFSVGIFAQGLFSGISSMGARAISETERALRKERNEVKRRKIEWKE